jgi:SOS response regulatory protein OraA/RecX
MRNTLQEQYNLLKEGKMNKQHFFKSARHLFPDLITPTNSFTDAVTILKNRGVISEGIGGLVTTGKKQDWHAIFNENMTTLKEEKEAKAEEKETTKEVTDMATRGYDYKDEKNYDNVFGQEFLQGYYTEMKDPKNADKHVDELRAIVAKNLAKDINHYVKDGQFGIKGVGYTTEAPGLGEPKEPKGKFKSSGYGDLKESVLRLAIQDLIKEVLVEEGFKTGDYVKYDSKPCRVKAYHKMSDKYDLEDPEGKILKNIPADKVSKTAVKEALDKDAIKAEGEDAKKNAMKKRITNEIVTRKKKMKALQTLTELDEEVNEENAKKLKELQSEIKQLEGMMGKLDGKKKVKEGTKTIVTTTGNDEEQAIQSDPTIKNKQAAVKAVKNAAPGTSVVVPTTGN